MGDSEKPFACPSPGCNMSFTNEDHLVVHRKKHDMVLNLGANGKNTFVADQTPTPTRFIRNCEEVGLFQDLQNVNPFEETFRRAVEDGKTMALSESEGGGTDDTLHTPHIFPNIAEASADLANSASPDKSKEASSSEEISHSNEREDAAANEPEVNRAELTSLKKPAVGGIVVRNARTLVAPKIIEGSRTNLSINGQEVQLLLKTADGKLVQLSAVPVSASRNDQTSEPRVVRPKIEEAKKIPAVDDKLAIAKMRLKQALTKSSQGEAPAARNDPEIPEKTRNVRTCHEKSSVANLSEQRRKQDVLARNRASSMRARAKRKAWIQQLQKVATSANEKNAALQLEVKALRSEVTKLRSLLLAHEDCSVTRAMGKGTPIVVQESKSPSIVRTLVHNVNASASRVLSSSRRRATIETRTETPIAPKVPKLLASNAAAVILPKTAETIGPTGYLIRDLPSLRIVDVRTIASEPNISPASRIHLVDSSNSSNLMTSRIGQDSDPTNSTDSNPRTNPSTLQIHAASKCTGT